MAQQRPSVQAHTRQLLELSRLKEQHDQILQVLGLNDLRRPW